MDGCACNIISPKFTNGFPPYSLTGNKNNFYYLSNGELICNNLGFEYPLGMDLIKTFGAYTQPYPEQDYCLKPIQTPMEVMLYNKTSNMVILQMPEPQREFDCDAFTMPTPEYRIYYSEFNGSRNECTTYPKFVLTYEGFVKIQNLKPFTKYMFCLLISNYYTGVYGGSVVFGNSVVIETAAGAPSKAENIKAIVLNPTTIKVTWDPPIRISDKSVNYEVHWRTEEPTTGIRQKGELKTSTKREALLEKLLQNHTYSILVRTHSPNSDVFTDSEGIQIETYPEPNNITIENVTAYSVVLRWEKCSNISSHSIRFSKIGFNSWVVLQNESMEGGDDGVLVYKVEGLQPKTQYKFQMMLMYSNSEEVYEWPADMRFKVQTLGDKPSAPGKPMIEQVRGEVYRVSWEMANDNGSPLYEYRLELRTDSPEITYNTRIVKRSNRTMYTNSTKRAGLESIIGEAHLDSHENYSITQSSEPYIDEDEVEYEWKDIYNGSENYWLVTDLTPHRKYWFRVAALNSYGLGPYSEISNAFEVGVQAAGDQLIYQSQQLTMFAAIIVPIVVVVCLISSCCLLCGKYELSI